MSTPDRLADPDRIGSYTYGTADRSPVTLDELRRLEAAASLTPADDALLTEAGAILAPYVDSVTPLRRPSRIRARVSQAGR